MDDDFDDFDSEGTYLDFIESDGIDFHDWTKEKWAKWPHTAAEDKLPNWRSEQILMFLTQKHPYVTHADLVNFVMWFVHECRNLSRDTISNTLQNYTTNTYDRHPDALGKRIKRWCWIKRPNFYRYVRRLVTLSNDEILLIDDSYHDLIIDIQVKRTAFAEFAAKLAHGLITPDEDVPLLTKPPRTPKPK